MRSRYFLYPVHISGAFLQTPSLSSALYLTWLRLLHRQVKITETIAVDRNISSMNQSPGFLNRVFPTRN